MGAVRDSDSVVDIAVIGGGIFGLLVAREAVSRGLSVAVFEKGAIGSQTSANSHCIIHSGIRYLQRAALYRVVDSARSLHLWQKEFPTEVEKLPCWMPVWRSGGLKGTVALNAAHLFYRALLKGMGEMVPQWPGVVSQGKMPDHPLLRRQGVVAAFGWRDGWLRDHRSVIAKCREAIIASGGGEIRERCPVAGVARADGQFLIQLVHGAEVTARAVVDVRGPWVRESLSGLSPSSTRVLHRESWCLGFNVVLSRDMSEGRGIAVPTRSGRMLFVAPRNVPGSLVSFGRNAPSPALSAIGTGYLPITGSEPPVVQEEDIAALLAEVNDAAGYLSNDERWLSINDVIGVEQGVLPRDQRMVDSVVADPTTRILDGGGGNRYLVVESGKYTIAPVYARRIVDDVLRELGRQSRVVMDRSSVTVHP